MYSQTLCNKVYNVQVIFNQIISKKLQRIELDFC